MEERQEKRLLEIDSVEQVFIELLKRGTVFGDCKHPRAEQLPPADLEISSLYSIRVTVGFSLI
jgi:hypothetical protein